MLQTRPVLSPQTSSLFRGTLEAEISLLFEAPRRKVVLTQHTHSSSNGFCVHPASNYSSVCPAGKQLTLSKHHGRMIIKAREGESLGFPLYPCYNVQYTTILNPFSFILRQGWNIECWFLRLVIIEEVSEEWRIKLRSGGGMTCGPTHSWPQWHDRECHWVATVIETFQVDSVSL